MVRVAVNQRHPCSLPDATPRVEPKRDVQSRVAGTRDDNACAPDRICILHVRALPGQQGRFRSPPSLTANRSSGIVPWSDPAVLLRMDLGHSSIRPRGGPSSGCRDGASPARLTRDGVGAILNAFILSVLTEIRRPL